MSVSRYPEYKDSGVEWLGEVPAHWEVHALKRIADLKSGDAIVSENISENGDYMVFGGNGSRGYTDSYTHDGSYALIGRQGALCGNINYESGKFWASEHAVVVSPKRAVETRWLGELLRAMNLNQYSIAAAQPGLSMDVISNLRIPLPELDEQSAIASFLDHETVKIDALVTEQENLITLLKEKRQAVISQAVTKGLDPTVPMKDSGVGWLGEVPAHWEVMSLRRCSKVQTGGTPANAPPGTDMEQGMVWYTPGDFGDSLVLTTSVRTVSQEAVVSGEVKIFPEGSALIVSIGATLGKVGFARKPSSAKQQINAVVPSVRVDGYFLAYSLSVKAEFMRFLSNSSTIGIMNQEKTKEICLAVPPRREQEAVITYLDQAMTKVDVLTDEANWTIDLLKERRSALISAAVTGQIDVRQHAMATV